MRASSKNLARIGLGYIIAGPLLSACGQDQVDRIPDDESVQSGGSGGGLIESGRGDDPDQDDSSSGGSHTNSAGGSKSGEPDPPENPACVLSGAGLEREKIPPFPGTTTLTRDKVWVVDGLTLVREGEVLTIEPCTRIESDRRDSALVVGRGGQIIAEGTADQPILFTSWAPVGERQAGDWLGVKLLGKAPTTEGEEAIINGFPDDPDHFYGGEDPNDSSGAMSYVRIEYAGAGNPFDLSGLTLAGVGAGTELHHVMVAHTLDDCFEWYGGTVSAHHLVALGCGDDSFDIDQGYNGNLSTLFGRTGVIDSSDPNGWEVDGKIATIPLTHVTSDHVTLCGPGEDHAPIDPSYGAVLREGATGDFKNQVILGFHQGFSLRDDLGSVEDPHLTFTDSLVFENFVNNLGEPHAATPDAIDPVAWFNYEGRNNSEPKPPPFTVEDCQTEGGPNAAVTGSGIGAFAEESDWLEGDWVSWDAD